VKTRYHLGVYIVVSHSHKWGRLLTRYVESSIDARVKHDFGSIIQKISAPRPCFRHHPWTHAPRRAIVSRIKFETYERNKKGHASFGLAEMRRHAKLHKSAGKSIMSPQTSVSHSSNFGKEQTLEERYTFSGRYCCAAFEARHPRPYVVPPWLSKC
jgi:hypothetical protein